MAHHLLNPLFSGDRGSSLDSEVRVSLSVVIVPISLPRVVRQEKETFLYMIVTLKVLPKLFRLNMIKPIKNSNYIPYLQNAEHNPELGQSGDSACPD